jgi:hypothetical protein
MLEQLFPAAAGQAPRFVGARMTVGTHVPFHRDASALDAGAAARASVLFAFGAPRVLSFCSLQRGPQDPRWQVQMRHRHGDALVLHGELTQRCTYGALNLGMPFAEFELRYAAPAAQCGAQQ